MGLFKNLFRRNKKMEADAVNEEENWEPGPIKRTDMDMTDDYQRDKFVRNCCEQLRDASAEAEKLTMEYKLVTAYLMDIEEIESLPELDKEELQECASKIVRIETERKGLKVKKGHLSEQQYRLMERMEDEMPEGYDTLKKAEEYQVLIKQDLSKLDGEKQAYFYRHDELREAIENAKGMAKITFWAFIVCIIILAVLKLLLEIDIKIGCFLAVGVAAIVVTVYFCKHMDYVKEITHVENGINKITLLQNRVKIRYINNTNLMDYLYLKYQVQNAGELKRIWDYYVEEREERERYEKAKSELQLLYHDLVRILEHYQIEEPGVWLHQTIALVDSREMVEVRHSLIGRRQKLRKQMDYNESLANVAKEEIKKLVESYPHYAKSILKIVDEYEKKQ